MSTLGEMTEAAVKYGWRRSKATGGRFEFSRRNLTITVVPMTGDRATAQLQVQKSTGPATIVLPSGADEVDTVMDWMRRRW